MSSTIIVFSTLSCLFGLVFSQGHDHLHGQSHGHTDQQHGIHSPGHGNVDSIHGVTPPRHGNVESFHGVTPPSLGHLDGIHVDIPGEQRPGSGHGSHGHGEAGVRVVRPGEHGNNTPFNIIHRPGETRGHNHGHGQSGVHVDRPGEHGNNTPFNVVHRPGETHGHDHGRGQGGVHVDRPGEHGNNTPFNVVHRPGQPHGTPGETHGTHGEPHGTHGQPHGTPNEPHGHGHGAGGVHVDRPGEHGNNTPFNLVHRPGETHGQPHGIPHSGQDNGHQNTGIHHGSVTPTIPLVTPPPLGTLPIVRPDLHVPQFVPSVVGGPFVHPIRYPSFMHYRPTFVGIHPRYYPRSPIYPYNVPVPVRYPRYPVGVMRHGGGSYRRHGTPVATSAVSPHLVSALLNAARALG